MDTKRYVYYLEDKMYVGYLEEFPDYRTQGKNLKELQVNLLDIYKELIKGEIPCVRHVAELEIG